MARMARATSLPGAIACRIDLEIPESEIESVTQQILRMEPPEPQPRISPRQPEAHKTPAARIAKDIVLGDASRTAILFGVNAPAEAVKATLGPEGRNVVIVRKSGLPTISREGATVAMRIDSQDALQNMGGSMVREVGSRTAVVAGDGATTATVLAQAIYRADIKAVTPSANPMTLKRRIDKAVEAIIGK